MKDPFIVKDSQGNYVMNKKHGYHYQMQMQLFLLEKGEGYLVIWSEKEMISMVVGKDLEFWKEKSSKALDFSTK